MTSSALRMRIRGARPAALLRQRDQSRAAVRRQPTPRLFQGRHSTTTSSAATPRRSTRRGDGTKGAGTLSPRRARPAASIVVRVRLAPAGTDRGSPFDRLRRDIRARASPRPTRSTPRCRRTSPTRTCAASSAKRSPACCGPSNSIDFDVRQWLDGDPLPAAAARKPQARPQQRLAPSHRRRHHLDARQMGISLVRRLGPRLPLRHACR